MRFQDQINSTRIATFLDDNLLITFRRYIIFLHIYIIIFLHLELEIMSGITASNE